MAKPRILFLVNRWYVDGGIENFLEQLIAETSGTNEYAICSLITAVDSDAECTKLGPVLKSGRVQGIHRRIIHSYNAGAEISANPAKKMVVTEEDVIYREFSRLLSVEEEYATMSHASNPYGDGHASERIADVLGRR